VQISSFQILLCFIIPIITATLVLIFWVMPFEYGIYVQAATATATAQTKTTTITTTSPDLAKVIIDNAIQELQSDNISETITHLREYEQELSLALTGNNTDDRYFPFQSLSTLLLVKDVIRSLENGDTNKAAVYLNLADQQIGRTLLNIPSLLPPNATTNITAAAAHIPTGTFLTYTNPKYGIKIQYQYNWIVEGNDYPTGAGGIQIASFYLPDVINGLPFFRIGVDNVTNSSLAGNRAYTVVWTYTHPTYGIRKSIEIATVIGGGKGYFVDYTAAAAKFSNYLPIVQKMIESFEIIK
jgi:hypothetical protein